MIVNTRLKETIDSSGYTYRDIESLTGIPFATVRRYATGSTENIPIDRIQKIARVLRVNPLWLMGISEDRKPIVPTAVGIRPVNEQKRIPVLGRIACGSPITAEQNVERYEYTDDESIDYALDAVGDSMKDAGINDGDIVYIHAQAEVENGEIGAVIIDGEATLKKIYYNGEVITLVPCNDKYSPISFRKGQADVQIVGKAIGLRRRF